MSDASKPSAESAEKAYADAAAKAKAAPAAPPAVTPKAKVPAKAAAPTIAPVAKTITKAPVKKAVPIEKTAKPVARPAGVPAAVAQPAPVAVPTPEPVAEPQPAAFAVKPEESTPTITELKEKIMATAAPKMTPDYTQPLTEAFGEFQTRAKAAYEKGTEALTEATEFAKGNVEAIVESGKIFAAGAQDFGRTYVEEAKAAYETATADLKEMAAVKSPTELFQLQGKIMRRNFDALVATGSKNTEAMLKLANDTFAPITGRVNVAAEKLAKVA